MERSQAGGLQRVPLPEGAVVADAAPAAAGEGGGEDSDVVIVQEGEEEEEEVIVISDSEDEAEAEAAGGLLGTVVRVLRTEGEWMTCGACQLGGAELHHAPRSPYRASLGVHY